MAVIVLASGTFVPAAHAAPKSRNAVSASAAEVDTPPGQGDDPAQDPVGKVTILFERTTASKCPLTFKVHGSFEGLPAGAQVVQYRLVGTDEWKAVNVPADHGDVFTTVLETLDWEWDWETEKFSVQIEIRQPNGLTSNTLYYFKCGSPGAEETFGATAENIGLTAAGGPLAELVADAYLDAVQALSGAEVALVSRYGFRTDLNAGPVTYEELWDTRPAGLAVDVNEMTGAQLKKLLAYRNPSGWVLTPSASLRYTVEGGAVTEITLNGAPVTDTQVIKVAANYILMGGQEGFPKWEGTTTVYRGGPDDRGALASYIVKNSPVEAPKGDRVTIR
ncbi:5'-nucleotidase C-terminal domain-containing protein [Microtetraspora sp. AC03309]|uniref:5'-nucleotidase C-terminal domain-containing protein n=1 Tax=Microtetraspora sp. AC03309 TaxID=2779376 RepID=UPI001E58FA74|nr:5'-nucleotidase [Microtetraspora sp. AC03309]MCC5580288.1 5'-nucleotidase C-terminal domain-containing protein [Microtetraspora sp. AC03309]